MNASVFNITKNAHSARFGTRHRCEIMRHTIRFADATVIVTDPHHAARDLFDWAHGCATLDAHVKHVVGKMHMCHAMRCRAALRTTWTFSTKN
jgi:hypothetical protein